TQIANGFPIFSILVPNSGGGTFQDDDGTSYATCQAILNAYNSGSLHHVLGVYVSDSTLTGDIVSCTNSGGCTMNSVQCYAGWDASGGSLSGSTASIPLGTNALACTYIDTTSLGSAPPAVGAWGSAPLAVTVNGDLSFTNGWVDAY
ncbi:MAG: hypothetical protein ACXVCG_21495, partial [Bdellovibrionota bacterium]